MSQSTNLPAFTGGGLRPILLAVVATLVVLAAPARAQLYADVSTTMGDFTLEMFYKESPKTAANFVSLAEGSRKWIDPESGVVRENTPYFDGIIFHRVIEGFMNQVGSPQGTGSDGPGYVFCDEVSNGVLHDQAYLLSSANSGPNTNGSQLFITVAETPWLDGIHTVFGKVSSGTEVIDAINSVETNASDRPVEEVSITSITIRRVGEEAMAFDVTAQELPEVEQTPIGIKESPDGMTLVADQPAGTSMGVFRSQNLATWSDESRHIGPLSPELTEYELSGEEVREFYRASLVRWPAEASFPSDFESWVFTIFDSVTGFEFKLDCSDPVTLSFNGDDLLVDMERSTFESDGYGCNILLFLPPETLVPLRFRLGADLPIEGSPSGRMTGTAFRSFPLQNIQMGGSFSMAPAP
ncbi:MAG: peptidylprolyl isomerase [Verrucomicrobiales bacterium]